jgi:uncharacterized protein (TIGR03437 family)
MITSSWTDLSANLAQPDGMGIIGLGDEQREDFMERIPVLGWTHAGEGLRARETPARAVSVRRTSLLALGRLLKRVSTLMVFGLLLLAHSPRAEGQVVLSAAVNGASYLYSSLPNGKLAQGVLFIAFGQGMGPSVLAQASSFPLPKNLSGTSIRVTVGGTNVDCIVLYTTATQVAAVLPSNTPPGAGTMVVTYNGQSSAPLDITVVAHAFGIFAVNQGGNGPGVFTDPFTNVANSLVTAANATNILDIWGTGLGAVIGDEGAGPLPGDLTNVNVQVFVGGQQAQVQYRGRSGCCAGVDQIRIVVPAVYGCYVPVYVVVEGVVSNFISISIAQAGSLCSDPGGYDPALLQLAQTNGGLRTASVYLNRMRGYAPSLEFQTDSAGASFVRIPLQALLMSGTAPVAGSCQVVQFPLATPAALSYLDAGPQVSMNSPMGTYSLTPPLFGSPVGLYNITFLPGVTGVPGIVGDGTLLQTGHYTFTGPGGSQVGPFTTSIDLPTPLDWTNRTSITTINRSQPLPITWTNGFAGAMVAIVGQSQVSPGVGATFTCWANAAAGSFTVPAAVLSAVPPSYSDSSGAQGSLSVIQNYYVSGLVPTGIDYGGTFFGDTINVSAVAFQ